MINELTEGEPEDLEEEREEAAAGDEVGEGESEPGGKAKRGPAKRAYIEELDDEILKGARQVMPKIAKMLETNASNVLALRKAVEAATKNSQARKDRRNASKRDERRRRMVEDGPQSLSKVKLEGD